MPPNEKQPANNAQPQPGAVIAPASADEQTIPETPAVQPRAAIEAPVQPTEPPANLPSAAEPLTPTETEKPPIEDAEIPPEASAIETDGQSISWTASEFIAHHKSSGWYAVLIMVAIAASVLMYLITRDVISVLVIVVGAVMLGVYAAHQPRQIGYTLSLGSLTIGDTIHSYSEYKSFSIVREGAFASIVFMPLQRFAVPTTIYYAPEDEEAIMEVLSQHLPYEEPRRDTVNSLMKKIRY